MFILNIVLICAAIFLDINENSENESFMTDNKSASFLNDLLIAAYCN